MSSVSELAGEALELIRDVGWWQSLSLPARVGHCMMTAVNAVARCRQYELSGSWMTAFPPELKAGVEATVTAMADLVRAEYPDRMPSWAVNYDHVLTVDGMAAPVLNQGLVIYFNDHPETRQDDVERVLEKLAAS